MEGAWRRGRRDPRELRCACVATRGTVGLHILISYHKSRTIAKAYTK